MTHAPSSKDKSAFDRAVNSCLYDKRVKSYFDRGHVTFYQVKQLLIQSDIFDRATHLKSYTAYSSLQDELAKRSQERSEILNDPITIRAIIGLALSALSGILFLSMLGSGAINNLILLASVLCSGTAGYLLARVRKLDQHGPAYFIPPALLLLAALALPLFLHHRIAPSWDLVGEYIVVTGTCAAVYFLPFGQISIKLRAMVNLSLDVTSSFFNTARLSALEDQWLNDSSESVIMPDVVLAINTLLGNEQDKLLVEQDSEGLRRLQDPTFRVSTRSRERIASLLSQMDGGSVAIAGPRGAGKSTLLKQFYQPSDKDIESIRGLTIYVSAPSNYVTRDFIAELFQQLCEGYLRHCEYSAQERLYRIGRSKTSARLATRKVLAISLLLLRTFLAILLVVWIASLFPKEFPSVISPASRFVDHWAFLTWRSTQDSWTAYRPYFLLGVLIVALALLPSPRVWRRYLWWHKESELVRRSREYLLRLQIDKTVTRGTTITSPGIRGLVFGMNRAASAKYNPWTLPELVSYTRQFLYDLAQSIVGARLPVIVAIDEIDRIGSLEQAEAFIGDIKTIFGVEKCYFLVAVAEDVGSLFAQRATAGRSILENAFDEIVVAGPLEMEEARDLLLKRVPGFTDAFVYLVYALSGGLPRELIRITRRLVEINLAQTDAGHYSRRLPDLALSLAKEGMIETLDASRNQLSRLGLQTGWAGCFDNIRSASIILRSKSSDPDKLYQVMEDISRLSPPKRDECEDGTSMSPQDEDAGLRIISRLSAYAYFSATIVDAFSDSNFDLTEAKRRTVAGADGSYEQLAVARVELSAFADSARMILDRFRGSLSLERISSR